MKMGNGKTVPMTAGGQVDINALIGNMLDRGVWDYYYTLYLGAGTTPNNTYALFNAPMNSPDPYPISGTPTLTKADTNMPQACSQGFSAPRDLLLDCIGFEFINTQLPDVQAIIQNSYFEFKIIDKVYFEGPIQDHPPGVGTFGVSTKTSESTWGLGWPGGPSTRNRFGKEFGKYIAPQMQFSLNLFFPKNPVFPSYPGIGSGAGTLQNSNQGSSNVTLKVHLFGLTDRAVQ